MLNAIINVQIFLKNSHSFYVIQLKTRIQNIRFNDYHHKIEINQIL